MFKALLSGNHGLVFNRAWISWRYHCLFSNMILSGLVHLLHKRKLLHFMLIVTITLFAGISKAFGDDVTTAAGSFKRSVTSSSLTVNTKIGRFCGMGITSKCPDDEYWRVDLLLIWRDGDKSKYKLVSEESFIWLKREHLPDLKIAPKTILFIENNQIRKFPDNCEEKCKDRSCKGLQKCFRKCIELYTSKKEI